MGDEPAGKPVLGTKLGGEAATIHELAQWYRGSIAPALEEAAEAINATMTEMAGTWTDDAATVFGAGLEDGRRSILKLADRVTELAGTYDQSADILAASQSRLGETERYAVAGNLRLDPNGLGIVQPVWGDNPGGTNMPIYDQHQLDHLYDNPMIKEWYDNCCKAFDECSESVDHAMAPVADQMDKLHEEGKLHWDELAFKATDIVRASSKRILEWQSESAGRAVAGAEHRSNVWKERAGRLRELGEHDLARSAENSARDDLKWASRAARQASRLGMVARALGPIGWGITGLEAANELHKGESAGKVFVTTGVGVGISTIAEIGAGMILIGGPFTLGLAITVIVVGGALSLVLSKVAGWGYDQLIPESPRERLSKADENLGDSGRVELEGP